MQIRCEMYGRTLVAYLSGELDHHNAVKTRGTLEEIIRRQNVKNLIFDCSELSFMDSSGIGVIIGRYKLVAGMGGVVAVSGANPHVDRILTLSGIKKLVGVYKNTDLALKAI